MSLQGVIVSITQQLEKNLFFKTIRGGLIMLIPILLLGSFSLVGTTFPWPAYLHFIHTFANGLIYNTLHMVYAGTFGILSIYMTIAIANSFRREHNFLASSSMGAMLTTAISFFIISGVSSQNFSIETVGTQGMSTAIITGYLASALYYKLYFLVQHKIRLFADGANSQFNNSIMITIPTALTVLTFTLINELISFTFHIPTLYDLIISCVNSIFLIIPKDFFSGLAFTVLSNLLWFFGVHGNDCLENTMQLLFYPAMQTNLLALKNGLVPTEILTKTFFDVFIFMGGCGSALCLLIALFIVGKRKSNRSLSKIATLPILFNMSEILLFGLPVILNPIMFIPFIFAPVVSYIVSYSVQSMGLVSVTISTVEWTTSVLLGGYLATNSIQGSLLQLFNIIVGVIIYIPFIKLLDKQKLLSAAENYQQFIDYYQSIEQANSNIMLIELDSESGELAKLLALDLKIALQKNEIVLYYQPQYHYNGSCLGVEALMRWKHPIFGTIYPPLIIQIANEIGILTSLERLNIMRAISDSEQIYAILGNNFKLSVNITGTTLASQGFVDFLSSTLRTKPDLKGKLILEVTEQIALHLNAQTDQTIAKIKELGVLLAIDDFSMGQTSIAYLKEKHFDLVKLDGSLIRSMRDNQRCIEIISSMVILSEALNFSILAEYVETQWQRETLARIGCYQYQGCLYAPALSLEDLSKLETKITE